MSEQKPAERTLQEIQAQYTNLCNKAGHLSYQVRTHQKDLELIYDALRDLNFEAAALQAREQGKAAEAALTKSSETKGVSKSKKLKEVSEHA